MSNSQSLSLEDVGGLDRLKLWLCQRDAAFSAKGRAFELRRPRAFW